jgi:hypothetical protein
VQARDLKQDNNKEAGFSGRTAGNGANRKVGDGTEAAAAALKPSAGPARTATAAEKLKESLESLRPLVSPEAFEEVSSNLRKQQEAVTQLAEETGQPEGPTPPPKNVVPFPSLATWTVLGKL